MQTTLHLLESDSQNLGGVLLTYPSGYQQQIAWHGLCSGSLREMGQALASNALDGLLKSGRSSDAERTNWASVAAGCGELYRVWKERVAKHQPVAIEA